MAKDGGNTWSDGLIQLRTRQAILAAQRQADEFASSLLPLVCELRGLGISSSGAIATGFIQRNVAAGAAANGPALPLRDCWTGKKARCDATRSSTERSLSSRLRPVPAKARRGGLRHDFETARRIARCRHPRVNRKPWTKSALRTYLLRYQPAFYEAIKSCGERRRRWVEAAIGEIRATGKCAACRRCRDAPALLGTRKWCASSCSLGALPELLGPSGSPISSGPSMARE